MKLSIIISSLARGGAEWQASRLALRLAQRGWEVSVIALLPARDLVNELEVGGVQVEIPAEGYEPSMLGAARRVRAALQAFGPDVVLSFMFHADLLSRVVTLGSNRPVIVSSVRSENMGGRGREWTLRATQRLSDATTANAWSVLEGLAQRSVARPETLHHIPNAIDVTLYDAPSSVTFDVREELSAGGDAFVWLAVGRHYVSKDYPNLLNAFAHVRQDRPEAQLWIAGEGDLRAEHERLAARLGLASACRFLGQRDDVPRLLAGCDGFVQASAWEGLPNSVLEALAASRPVVATDAGGTRELVLDGETGWLVKPRDAAALASAMLDVMAAPAVERAEMSSRGRKSVEAAYGIDRVVDQWVALFDALHRGEPTQQLSTAFTAS